MIEVIRQILAEQFSVQERDVLQTAYDLHSDGAIYGFEILNLESKTFIFAQISKSEWVNSDFQVHVPELGVWIRLWRFPSDPYLPGLAMVGVKPALSHLLSKIDSRFVTQEIQNVSYRPGKRAVFRVSTNLGVIFAKVTTTRNAARIVTLQELLAPHINTAELIGIANEDILFFRELPGVDFLDQPNPDYRDFANQVFEIQNSLSVLKTSIVAKRKVVSNLQWYLQSLESHFTSDFMKELSLLVDSSFQIDSLETSHLIHGDFHLGQFKVGRSNLGVLDFDNAGMGDIVEDQSTMLASSLFGVIVNKSAEVQSRYLGFLNEWLPMTLKGCDEVALKALTARHVVAFMASFPKVTAGKEDRFLHILRELRRDDENILILSSSLFH